MKYDLKLIGKRIRECRKEYRNEKYCKDRAPDMETFGCAMADVENIGGFAKGIDRRNISDWEKGEKLPTVDVMLRLCEMFDCELGYLLGEYPTKTRVAADVQEETGLSEESINILRKEAQKIKGIQETYNIDDMVPYRVGKLHLVDAFISGCEPINDSLDSLLFDQIMFDNLLDNSADHDSAKRYRQALLDNFNQIYDSPLNDYEKVTRYIETTLEWYGHKNEPVSSEEVERLKNLLYMEYQLLVNQRTNNRTNAYRNNMTLTFNQIIDSIIEQTNVDRKGENNGEFEKE